MLTILQEILRLRVRLITIWLVVMVIVVLRLVTMPDIYTSSCLLTVLPLEQVDQESRPMLSLGSARSLLSQGGDRDDYTILAFMKSRQLADAVVEELDLGSDLFPERWNASSEEWIQQRGGKPSPTESQRALRQYVDVSYDQFTGLLLLEVHWPSPEKARVIADGFMSNADGMLRRAAIAEGERRISELQQELEGSAIAEVGAYLAEEITRAISALTSIRARASYAFRIIDPPSIPDRKSWPPRLLIFLLVGATTAAVEIGAVAGLALRRNP